MRRPVYFSDQELRANDLNFGELSKKYTTQELLKGMIKVPGVSISTLTDTALQVSASGDTFSVEAGRGFDINGNEIIVPSEVTTFDPGKGASGDVDYRPAGILDPRTSITITDLTSHTFKVSIGYKEVNDPTSTKQDDKGVTRYTRIYNGYTITQTHSGDIPTNDLLLAEITYSPLGGGVTSVVDKRTAVALFAIEGNVLGQTVTVATANAQFSSVKSAVDSITDASSTNPKLVLIYPGIYVESGSIPLKSYISFAGFGPESTTIRNSSTSTFTTSTLSGSINLTGIKVENTGPSPALEVLGLPLGTVKVYNCEFLNTGTGQALLGSSDPIIISDECTFRAKNADPIVVNQGVGSGSLNLLRTAVFAEASSSYCLRLETSQFKASARECFFSPSASSGTPNAVIVSAFGTNQFLSLTRSYLRGVVRLAPTNSSTGSYQLLHCTFPQSTYVVGSQAPETTSIKPVVLGCIYKKTPTQQEVGTLVSPQSGSVDLGYNASDFNVNSLSTGLVAVDYI